MKEGKMNNLYLRQHYDLLLKTLWSKQRIWEFYYKMHGKVYISFSGGKDSTVLLHLVRQQFPEVPAVFVDTGLEYPEIREFVKTIDNVVWIKPEMNFREVLKKHGFPCVSKEQAKYIREVQNGTTEYIRKKRLYGKNGSRVGMISKKWQYLINSGIKISEKCCDVMKKRPFHKFEKKTNLKPYIGTMAEESQLRKRSYIEHGCNVFEEKKEKSSPLSIWKTSDIWEYIKMNNIKYSKIYDMGEKRTGCMFCMFGIQFDTEPNRFQRMEKTHPKQWKYCLDQLGCRKVLEILKIPYKHQNELF